MEFEPQSSEENREQPEDTGSLDMSCGIANLISNWWQTQKLLKYQFITLNIRDEVLNKQFASDELVHVKRRWELCTIIYTVALVLTGLLYLVTDSMD